MKRAVLVSAVAIVLTSAGLVAQGRNFGGTWTVDAEKTAAANVGVAGGGGGRGGGGGGAVTERRIVDAGAVAVAAGGGGRGGGGAMVARGDGSVAVTAGLTLTVDAGAFTIAQGQNTTAYKLDGSATTIESPRGKSTAKATWQGDKISIETTADGPNGPIVSHATWYLDGESLVRENKSTSADGQEIVRKTFYKRN